MADQEDQIIEDEEVVEDQSQEEAQEELQEEDEQQEELQQDEEIQDEELDNSQHQELPVQQQEQPISRRKELRIQKLLQKLDAPQQFVAPQSDGINYRDMIDADDAVYDQLGQVSQQYGQQQYQQGLSQANSLTFQTRLEVDAPKVEAKYPVLDETSEEFNPAVADSFNQMYLSAVGYDPQSGSVQNPNLRYSDYIESMFELVNEAASRKVETTRKNITTQAANTALRPNGRTNESLNLSKAPQDMSDKELDAVIAKMGFAPKKR